MLSARAAAPPGVPSAAALLSDAPVWTSVGPQSATTLRGVNVASLTNVGDARAPESSAAAGSRIILRPLASNARLRS